MAASTLMQFSLGVLGPYITQEFALTRTTFGTAGSALYLSGLVASLLAGRLVNRWGEVRLTRLVHVIVIAAFLMVAFAPNWAWVLAAAAMMGLPLGIGNPITNVLIVNRVDDAVQGTATGIKQSGVQIGALLAGAVVPPIAAAYSWRPAVGLLGVLAFAGLMLSLPLRQAPSSGRAELSLDGSRKQGRPSSLAAFLGVYAALMGCGTSAVISFLPLFAHGELSLPASRAGQLIAVVGLVGAAARVLMGVLGNRISRFEPLLVVLAAVAMGSAGMLVAASSRPYLVWLAVIGLGASAIAWQTPAMLAVVRERRIAAQSSGVVMTGFIGGMMIGPLTFGSLVDATSSYLLGWILVTAAFAAATLLSLIATVRKPAT